MRNYEGYLINEVSDEEWGPAEVNFHVDIINKIGAKGTPKCSLEGHTHDSLEGFFVHDGHFCLGTAPITIDTIGLIAIDRILYVDIWNGSGWDHSISF